MQRRFEYFATPTQASAEQETQDRSPLSLSESSGAAGAVEYLFANGRWGEAKVQLARLQRQQRKRDEKKEFQRRAASDREVSVCHY
jgi:hypothetical protein